MSDDTIDAILRFVEEDTNTPVPADAATHTPLGRDGLGLESLSILELTLSLERNFGISLPDSEFEDYAAMTVGDLARLVERHRHETGVSADVDPGR